MSLFQIADLEDPRLAPYRDLKLTNQTRWSGQFIAEGDKVVERLLASDYEIESILIAARHVADWQPKIPDSVPTFVVADDWIEQIVGFNFHRGLLACGRRKVNPTLDSIIPAANHSATLVICPDVQSPENLGAILRIAAGLGVDAVLLGPRAGDPLSRRVLRVSMGFALWLPIYIMSNCAQEFRYLQDKHQIELIATILDPSATPLTSFTPRLRQALVLGSEGHGLEQELIELCQHRVTIPMSRGVDSLNVAITTGIMLHHLRRD